MSWTVNKHSTLSSLGHCCWCTHVNKCPTLYSVVFIWKKKDAFSLSTCCHFLNHGNSFLPGLLHKTGTQRALFYCSNSEGVYICSCLDHLSRWSTFFDVLLQCPVPHVHIAILFIIWSHAWRDLKHTQTSIEIFHFFQHMLACHIAFCSEESFLNVLPNNNN